MRTMTTQPPPALEVRNYQSPGGAGYLPPDAEHPYWRMAVSGERQDFLTLVAGADQETVRWLRRHHADAIARLVHEAVCGEAATDGGARRLISAAARLGQETLGGFPSWAIAPRR